MTRPVRLSLTLSVPSSHQSVTHHKLAGTGSQPFAVWAADRIKSFARANGIAPVAVDYSVRRG